MDTTARGDAFEQRVYGALVKELENERWGVSPRAARIFQRKAYHSRDRQANIVTDVSIEVFLPGRERPSLIWIFECKDYSGKIPVSDIEEFHAKLQQIGEDNTKGTFVTSGGLQRSALAYARSKGIGVVRLLPSGQISTWLECLTQTSHKRGVDVDWTEFGRALTIPEHTSQRGFFASQDGYWFAGWRSLISHELLERTGIDCATSGA